MCLGILYCASNKEIKATKFFELCQMDLDAVISAEDKELKEFFIKLCEIAYEFMIKL